MLYTNQSAFDTVLDHLRQQKCRSMSNGQCAYRGENGLKCAIGVMIPDDKYSLDMDVFGSKLTFKNVLTITGLDNLNCELCAQMQVAHDNNWEDDDRDWSYTLERDFKAIAEEYSLNYTAPVE